MKRTLGLTLLLVMTASAPARAEPPLPMAAINGAKFVPPPSTPSGPSPAPAAEMIRAEVILDRARFLAWSHRWAEREQ